MNEDKVQYLVRELVSWVIGRPQSSTPEEYKRIGDLREQFAKDLWSLVNKYAQHRERG